MTRKCVGACGLMSMKATVSSSWWMILAGIWPAAILQKRQSGMASLVLRSDDQEVRRRLRVDVHEGDGVVVLVDDLGRDLAGGDLAEEAVGHGVPRSQI